MNTKRIFLASAIALGALMGYAQSTQEVVTEYEFIPHIYLQGQVGVQENLGEGSAFGDTFGGFNMQLGIGYQFNPLFGTRFNVDFLSKGKGVLELDGKKNKWSFNHLQLSLDGTFDLTNAFGGYNPERKWDLNLIGGIGLNVANGNDEAHNVKWSGTYVPTEGPLANLWDGSHWWFTGRIGAGADYKVTEDLSVGLEFTANALTDKYNSKKDSNLDWYFNILVGAKYTLGQTYNKKQVVVPAILPTTVQKDTVVIIQQVEAVVPEVQKEFVSPVPTETMTRNVFYKINSSVINNTEMAKVKEIADYMKAHPNATVHVTGYADKGTGTLAINLRLARLRADAVVDALVKKYGISESRIYSSSMTDHEFQPFEEPVLNRVAICVVE